MTTTKTNHRSIVSLNLPKTVPALLTYAQGIVTAMTGNPNFATPSPTLAMLQADVDGLRTAQLAAESRVRGAVLARNEKRTALVGLLQQEKSYVQGVADSNVENGASIIASAGLAVKKVSVRKPRVFGARPGKLPGTVEVIAASAARRASYEWSYSIDGGKTWVALPVTLQAKTTVTGLAPGSTTMFRYRAVTRIGEGEWSSTVSLTLLP